VVYASSACALQSISDGNTDGNTAPRRANRV